MHNFAYGANLDIETMRDRCPDAQLIGKGDLVGYRFITNRNGVASIVESVQDCVHGLIWKLSQEDEDFLDLFEGVKGGWYHKRKVMVHCAEREMECMVYIASDQTPGKPVEDYFNTIVSNCIRHGFPKKYIDSLLLREWLWRS